MKTENPRSLGYSTVMNDFLRGDNDFRNDVMELIRLAKARLPVRIGEPNGQDIIKHILPLEGVKTVDSTSSSLTDIFNNALKIRNTVEWNGWGADTAYPGVREHSEAGEPFGQCLVTSRFAKDYFPGARLTEVRVEHYSGEIVGPHIILTIPSADGRDMALDLTPDQAFAAGEIPLPAKALNPYLKVNIIPFDDNRCPYIFVRYQEDDELATKRSRPLEHTRLLKDKVAFALGLPVSNNLEKYAVDIETARFPESLDEFLAQQIARHNVTDGSDRRQDFYIQSAVIDPIELRPEPKWLWETAGLSGASKAIIYHNGFPQEFLNFDGKSIYLNNLCGVNPTEEILEYGESIIEDDKTRVIAGLPLIVQHVEAKKWSGPIFVQ